MKPTYQHKFVANHLQGTYANMENWPFSSESEIEEELCKKEVAISPGEYLVVGLTDDGGCVGKVGGLQGLADFPRTSLVIPYHEIERLFHEQHAEWVEL